MDLIHAFADHLEDRLCEFCQRRARQVGIAELQDTRRQAKKFAIELRVSKLCERQQITACPGTRKSRLLGDDWRCERDLRSIECINDGKPLLERADEIAVRLASFVASTRTSTLMILVIAIGDGAFPKDHEQADVPDA
nr:hypothetical protein [Paraburkholderia hospita]